MYFFPHGVTYQVGLELIEVNIEGPVKSAVEAKMSKLVKDFFHLRDAVIEEMICAISLLRFVYVGAGIWRLSLHRS